MEKEEAQLEQATDGIPKLTGELVAVSIPEAVVETLGEESVEQVVEVEAPEFTVEELDSFINTTFKMSVSIDQRQSPEKLGYDNYRDTKLGQLARAVESGQLAGKPSLRIVGKGVVLGSVRNVQAVKKYYGTKVRDELLTGEANPVAADVLKRIDSIVTYHMHQLVGAEHEPAAFTAHAQSFGGRLGETMRVISRLDISDEAKSRIELFFNGLAVGVTPPEGKKVYLGAIRKLLSK